MTNPNGRFGIHGGQYIPETLMNAVIELEEAYNHYKNDPEFNRELTELLNEYAGRPSRLYYAEKMTKDLGGAKIYLKREDLNHTGAHKINHAIVFLAVFISLRHLTGGFHASTYFKCNLSMCIVFILDIFSNEIIHSYFIAITFIVHILLSSLVILVYCPVENKNKPIPDECVWKYKISALILSHTFSIIGWILFRNNIDIGLFIIMTIIYIHILVVVSKLIREEEKHESK